MQSITVGSLTINTAQPSVVDYLTLSRIYLRYGLINEDGIVSFKTFVGTVSQMTDPDVDKMKSLTYKKSAVDGQKVALSDNAFADDPSLIYLYMYKYLTLNFMSLVNLILGK